MRALIVANGDISHLHQLESECLLADLIIAVDGGARHLCNVNRVPHLWVGDMDSTNNANLWQDEHLHNNLDILVYAPEKDQSDSELAIRVALDRGATEVRMMGMLGGRVDHMLFNLHLMVALIEAGANPVILDGGTEIRCVIGPGQLAFSNKVNATLSVVPMTALTGVDIVGCKYALHQAHMKVGNALGLSNVIVQDHAVVSVHRGTAYLVCIEE